MMPHTQCATRAHLCMSQSTNPKTTYVTCLSSVVAFPICIAQCCPCALICRAHSTNPCCKCRCASTSVCGRQRMHQAKQRCLHHKCRTQHRKASFCHRAVANFLEPNKFEIILIRVAPCPTPLCAILQHCNVSVSMIS